MNFLADMAVQSAARVREARAARSEAALLATCAALPPAPPFELGEFGVIAEIKRTSPAEGMLGAGIDVAARARTYAAGGAAAVSVLTEPARFAGSVADLEAAVAALQATRVPAMRKDFLVDPWQVLEARAAGAGGVLLIVAMLGDAALRELHATARAYGLFTLLEAFDEADLERAAKCLERETGGPPCLVGVNTRDLRTLAVDTSRLERLAPVLPAGVPAVAESGLYTAADAVRAAQLGYRAALVGTALMRAADPGGLVAAMRQAGSEAWRERAG